MTPRRSFLSAIVFLLTAPWFPAFAANPAPFDLRVKVFYAEEIGRELLREELELAVFERLQEAGCFRSVTLDRTAEPADTDLLFELILRQVVDETEYAMTLAQRSDPRIPDQEKREVARLQIDYTLRLSTVSEGLPVRQRSPRSDEAYRPLANEDPRYEVELRSVATLSRSARDFVCRGSARKLEKRVAKLRREAAESR